MENRRFAHAPTFTKARGKVRVTCCCGWTGVRCASTEEAHVAYGKHVGHREQKERPRVDVGLDPEAERVGVEMLFDSARYPAIWLH